MTTLGGGESLWQLLDSIRGDVRDLRAHAMRLEEEIHTLGQQMVTRKEFTAYQTVRTAQTRFYWGTVLAIISLLVTAIVAAVGFIR